MNVWGQNETADAIVGRNSSLSEFFQSVQEVRSKDARVVLQTRGFCGNYKEAGSYEESEQSWI